MDIVTVLLFVLIAIVVFVPRRCITGSHEETFFVGPKWYKRKNLTVRWHA